MVDASLAFFDRLEDIIRKSTDDPELTSPAKILAEVGSPTASIAILEDGEITSHCISTIGHDEETLFQACSISKPTFGLCVMKLVELEYLSIDDKICDHLPSEIIDMLAHEPKTRDLLYTVTVKQLMSHTAGLSVHGFPGYSDHDNVPSVLQIIKGKYPANTRAVRFASLPGLDFNYSGGGIEVLQCVVEHVMKKPLPELMETYLFKPLGMTRTCYKLISQEKNFAKAYHTGYTPCESEYHILPELGAAGIWTTPTDLLKLVRAIQRSLDGGHDDAFLRTDTAKKMLTQVKSSICLTWFANDTAFGHGGDNFPGYECTLYGYADLPWNSKAAEKGDSVAKSDNPPRNCGISIMTNSAWGHSVYWRLIHAITYLKGWPEAPTFPDNQTLQGLPFRTQQNLRDETDWKDYADQKWSDGWQISTDENGHLVAGIDRQALIALRQAAIPPKKYSGDEKSVDLLLDGTDIILRLGWEKGERVIEMWSEAESTYKIIRIEK